MLNFGFIAFQSPNSERYFFVSNLERFYKHRLASWKCLPHQVKTQKQTQADQQAQAERDWEKALNLPDKALDGLHLIFGTDENCRKSLLDPATAQILRAPDHRVRVAFSRTHNRVKAQITSSIGQLSFRYPFSLTLLNSVENLNQIRATRFLRNTLPEQNSTQTTSEPQLPKSRTVTVLPDVIEPVLRQGPTNKDFLLITID